MNIKLLGKVLEYKINDSFGYIEGYDGIVYLFHQIHVQDDIILKKGDIVKFKFIMTEDKNMPYAMDIEKC